MTTTSPGSWVELDTDHDTGIELLRAHFEGHAYDPHWHDSYLIGYTEEGLQQFNCRRQVQRSTPGHSFLLEPGEIHDGEAPHQAGFTYRNLYLPRQWLHRQLGNLFEDMPDQYELHVAETLSTDRRLVASIASAFLALRQREPRIVREACLDQMLERVTAHTHWRKKQESELHLPALARRCQEYLHANLYDNIGLNDMAAALGTDRFRLTRAFKTAFGIGPHAYLIQLRLVRARQLLALGWQPVDVASELCFSDQSHLGRWFRRAYKLTPADYRKRYTKLPD